MIEKKKKMLIICSRPPFPMIGGDRVRFFNNIKVLSEIYELSLIYISDEDSKEINEKELKNYCKEIKEFYFPKIRFYFNAFYGIFNKLPLQVNYYYFKKIQKWIDQNKDKYDLVFCNHIRTTQYFLNYDSTYKIVDFVDAISMNYKKAKRKVRGIWKYIYILEEKRVLDYELNISKKFNKKNIISSVDRDFLYFYGAQDINIIHNYVNETIVKKNIAINKNKIIFLGKMNYEPNITAVKYFSKEIFPLLKQEFKNLEFYIVGAFPTKEIKKLEKINGIKVTGFVENPKDYILEAKLFVAPMISGAGIQNKILEAMELGKTVITTPIGIEGLDQIKNYEEILVAKNKNEYIEIIMKCLNGNIDVEKIGRKGHDYVIKNFSFYKVKQEYLKIEKLI